MQNWKMAAAVIVLAAVGATPVLAQSANEPNITAPASKTVPPTGTASQGMSTGESGATAPDVTAPAGNASDPTTSENQQPGMSPHNPSDPAAGDNPGARAPSSPAGTGSSSP